MKKLALLLVLSVLLGFAAPAAAESTQDTVMQMAQGLLTEVYGYTQEEADGFTYDISGEEHVWVVRFYQNPEWVYRAEIDKVKLEFSVYSTPFTTLQIPKASENSVRDVLRRIEANGWFDRWNKDSQTAFMEAVGGCDDIRRTTPLMRGLASDQYTPAQALDDFFYACYGNAAQWSKALLQWRDAAFASFGLTREAAVTPIRQGITEYLSDDLGADGSTIYEFVGAVPEILAQALSHPKLQGWECLAGACQARNAPGEVDWPGGKGLAAFARGDERLLVMLVQNAKTLKWKALPVSETALYKDRELYIRYDGSIGRFDIVYPVSDTEMEYFQCRMANVYKALEDSMVCGLEKYCRVSFEDNSMFEVDQGTSYSVSKWYHAVTTQNGVTEEAQYPALCSGMMEYIDASAFPKTAEECRAAAEASPSVPAGYGFSSNVHLRAKATSHSNDLGMYQSGTLVEVLDTKPGSDFPWYHVRIGIMEGYMSGNYVSYSEDEPSIIRYAALSVGRLKNDTALKNGTGIFAGTAADLPAGTIVRVLAEYGNWLHVSVPLDEDGWLMQPGETDGYIKKDAAVQAATPLQLTWLAPED